MIIKKKKPLTAKALDRVQDYDKFIAFALPVPLPAQNNPRSSSLTYNDPIQETLMYI